MRLIFTDPRRPKDLFVINDRTDGDPIVHQGETFTVPDAAGRTLLAGYHPRLQVAPDKPGPKAKPVAAAKAKPQPTAAKRIGKG